MYKIRIDRANEAAGDLKVVVQWLCFECNLQRGSNEADVLRLRVRCHALSDQPLPLPPSTPISASVVVVVMGGGEEGGHESKMKLSFVVDVILVLMDK